MSYQEITTVETPNRTSRAVAAEDAKIRRYRMQLAAAFLPAATILVAAAIMIAKLLAA